MNKSYFVMFLLTLLFGPLGLFYFSTAAALGWLIAAFVFGGMTGGVGALVIWLLSIPVGLLSISRHNNQVALEENRHQALLDAKGDTK